MTRAERAWILYDWANSAFTVTVMTAVLPVYFKDVAGSGLPPHLATAYWGYANTVATLFIAALAPLLGSAADVTGNKKRFLAGFCLLGVSATVMLTGVSAGDWATCLAIYMLAVIGFSGANVFYDALLIDVTHPSRMDWISANGYAWGYLGSTIPFALSLCLIRWSSAFGLSSRAAAVRASFVLTAVWWLAFSVPLFLRVEQQTRGSGGQALRRGWQQLCSTFTGIRRHKQIFLFLAAYFFYIDGVDTIIRMAAVYGHDAGIGSDELLLILLATQIAAFPFALAFGKLAGRYSPKPLLLLGIAAYIVIVGLAYSADSNVDFWLLAMLVATSQGGIQALSRSCYGKLIPPGQSAEFFGFYNIFGKFAAVIGPTIVGVGAQATGSSRSGVLALILLFVAGGTLLLRVKPNA